MLRWRPFFNYHDFHFSDAGSAFKMVAEDVAGMVIDIAVGMEVLKVAKEVAQMVDSVFALILCPLYYVLLLPCMRFVVFIFIV